MDFHLFLLSNMIDILFIYSLETRAHPQLCTSINFNYFVCYLWHMNLYVWVLIIVVEKKSSWRDCFE